MPREQNSLAPALQKQQEQQQQKEEEPPALPPPLTQINTKNKQNNPPKKNKNKKNKNKKNTHKNKTTTSTTQKQITICKMCGVLCCININILYMYKHLTNNTLTYFRLDIPNIYFVYFSCLWDCVKDFLLLAN